jgi:predicted enzyme related to lactoylglutathione lyase
MTARFVWYDLNTKDKAKALDFYTKLLGWSTQSWKPEGAPDDMPAYDMICVGDKAFGGINELPAEAPAPSHWMGHVQIDDLDAAMKRAERLKGSFPMGVMEIPTVGRMAALIDPRGCSLSLFEPAGDSPELPGQQEHGMVGWNELITADVDAAKAFYSEVVGWKWREGPMTNEHEYHLFGTGEEGGDAGGMMPKPAQMPVSAWLLYFTTKDIDATVAKVKELGGTVMAEPFSIGDIGRIAMAVGPDGSTFGLAEWSFGD